MDDTFVKARAIFGARRNDAEAAMRLGFGAIRKEAGECPKTELLERWHLGVLEPAEAEQIADHIAGCGICELLIDRIRASEAADAKRSVRETINTLIRRMVAVFRKPLVAYTLLAIILIPAYHGLMTWKRDRETILKQGTATAITKAGSVNGARLIELTTTRGPERALRLSSDHQFLVFSFFVPFQEGLLYSGQVFNAAGRPVGNELTLHPTSVGNCYIVCDRRLFSGGNYLLVVREMSKDRLKLNEWRYPIVLLQEH